MDTTEILYLLLNDYRFYAREVDTVLAKMDMEKHELDAYVDAEENIEYFTYNGMEYIGTLDQKMRYERDKALGINRFEDNPVPFSNNIANDILHVCTWYQGRNVNACERVERFALFLQNDGVETDKGQPKSCDCDEEDCKPELNAGLLCKKQNKIAREG